MSLVSHYGFNERADLNKARQFTTVEQIKEFLKIKFCGGCCLGSDSLIRSGNYREMAINYDFRPWLKKYLIQFSHGELESAWAPSIGALRKAMHLSHNDKVFLFPTK